MKRLFLLLFVLWIPIFCSDFNEVFGKETNYNRNSFCIEGKTWNYILWYLDNDGRHEEFCSYIVRGDTIISDTIYKRVICQKDGIEKTAFMMREEGGKTFKRFPDREEKMFFDFERNDIGVVYTLGEMDYYWMIHTIDTILVNNRLFRRYSCYQVETGEFPDSTLTYIEYNDDCVLEDFWVEGIGSSSAAILADGMEIPSILPGYKTKFVSCYEGSECVFTAKDFIRPDYTTEIQVPRHHSLQNYQLFDLQGRPFKGMSKHGIYVKEGRKVIR
jgi:hypothetical protein